MTNSGERGCLVISIGCAVAIAIVVLAIAAGICAVMAYRSHS